MPMQRCKALVAIGRDYQLLRDGLWISDAMAPTSASDDESHGAARVTRLRRNLTVLGELPPHRGAALRPPR